MTTSKNIHEAINAIMAEVGYVQKTRSGGLNYTFAGEAALIAALRPAMVEHAVYMSVANITDIHRGEYTTAKGSVMQIVDLSATVRFTHAPSATSIDVVALGSGADTGDKASNKALTGAYKYALRQTFCIETGDDPDDRVSEPRAAKAQPAKPAAANGDEKLSKAWAAWASLCRKAQSANIAVPNLDAAASVDEIRTAYQTLKAQVPA